MKPRTLARCVCLVFLLASLHGRDLRAQDAAEASGLWVREAEVEAPWYFAVRVTDVGESTRWYGTVLGLEEAGGSRAEDGSWEIVNLTNGRLFVEIVRDDRARAATRPRGFYKVGFGVPDVRVVADGVEETSGRRPRVLEFAEFGVRIIQVRDPDANIIQLFSPLGDDDAGGP